MPAMKVAEQERVCVGTRELLPARLRAWQRALLWSRGAGSESRDTSDVTRSRCIMCAHMYVVSSTVRRCSGETSTATCAVTVCTPHLSTSRWLQLAVPTCGTCATAAQPATSNKRVKTRLQVEVRDGTTRWDLVLDGTFLFSKRAEPGRWRRTDIIGHRASHLSPKHVGVRVQKDVV